MSHLVEEILAYLKYSDFCAHAIKPAKDKMMEYIIGE